MIFTFNGQISLTIMAIGWLLVFTFVQSVFVSLVLLKYGKLYLLALKLRGSLRNAGDQKMDFRVL
jgi:hypothetical protein